MANKTKLTPEVIEKIEMALSNGLTRETAARYANISYQTFYNWRTRGKAAFDLKQTGKRIKKSEKIYFDFFNQIEGAEVEAIIGWQETVTRASKTDPTWAMKMLQLRDPNGYRSTDVNYSYDLTQATDEQLQRIAAGEDPLTVMADAGKSLAASTAEASGE